MINLYIHGVAENEVTKIDQLTKCTIGYSRCALRQIAAGRHLKLSTSYRDSKIDPE